METTVKPSPQSAVFYSTNRDWPWGAPDYAWPQAAHQLLDAHIKVIGILHPEALIQSEVKDLQKRGALFFPQPPLNFNRGRIGQIKKVLQFLTPDHLKRTRTLKNLEQAHVFINQGGDFDFLNEGPYLNLLTKNTITYDIIVHSTRHASPLPTDERTLANRIIGSSHRTYFNSQWTREIVENKLAVTISQADYFTYPVRKTPAQPLPWPDSEITMMACACRWDVFHKGLDVLLVALSKLKNHSQPWQLNLYGYGAEKDTAYLRDLILYHHLQDHVFLCPFEKDVTTIWEQNHLLILTSRFEGFGLAMLDAMACGRPVLRTPYGGAMEWIEEGETGYLCPAAEPGLITDSIDTALRQFSQWKVMGIAAYDKLKHNPQENPMSLFLRPFGINTPH